VARAPRRHSGHALVQPPDNSASIMSDRNDAPVGAMHDAAIAWLVRVQSDAASDADWRILASWLEESEAHRQAFETVELLFDEMGDHAQQIVAGVRERQGKVVQFASPKPRARPLHWIASLAAAAACLVAAPAVWRAYQGVPVVYRTQAGETREVSLADGTHIRMDAASELKVRLGWRSRRVEMAEAEATFDVAKDPARPFEIAVGDQRVRVVGTEFNIRHYDKTVVVTVRRGVVQVRPAAEDNAQPTRLTPGQELRHVEGAHESSLAEVDPNTAFAWTEGRLVCDDWPLSEIVAYLNRRYRVPVHLSPSVGNRRFSGVLELGDQGLLMQRLGEYMSLSVRRAETGFVLS
jgi:transmembrane sensor